MNLEIGQKATFSKTIVEQDVDRFAELTGDRNPVHIDEKLASESRFGKRIVHGMLVASMISAAIGMELPGPGAVYLSQSLQFKAPVFIGDTVTAVVVVAEVREDKPIVTLDTDCLNQNGDVVIQGRAVVLVDEETKRWAG